MAVRITIKRGKCQGNFHQIGDTFTVESTTPAGMCLGAWDAVSPYLSALLYGGNFPWVMWFKRNGHFAKSETNESEVSHECPPKSKEVHSRVQR